MDQNLPSGQAPESRLSPPGNLPKPPLPPSGGQSLAGEIDLKFSDPNAAAKLQGPPKLTPTAPLSVPTPPLSGPTEYTTAIRTMNDDIAKVKMGKQPSGTEVQKTVSAPQSIAPGVPPPAAPVPVPTGPGYRASLGQTERAQPLGGVSPSVRAPFPPPPPPMTSVDNSVPPADNSRKGLILALLTLVIVGVVGYLFLRGDDNVATRTPTPLVTQTPITTPTPLIGSYFLGEPESVVIIGTNPAILRIQIEALAIDGGEFKKIAVSSETKGSGDLDFIGILDYFLITYPLGIKSALGEDGLVLVYGQRESFNAQGQLSMEAPVQKRLVFLTEVRDTASINGLLSGWEPTIDQSLNSILGHSPALAGEEVFLDNIYSGTLIRYQNYPHPDRSIDYGLLQAPNGKLYLLLTASRESAFNSVDHLKR